jgi:hypothetical protein
MPEIIAQKILDLDAHEVAGLLKFLKKHQAHAFDPIKEILEDMQ